MAFSNAFASILRYEGGHSADTWYGIDHIEHPEVTPWPPSDAQVQAFYRQEWTDSRAGNVPEPADVVYFLSYVNTGPTQAVRLLQRALRSCGNRVTDDGVFGPNTLAALNKTPGDLLHIALRSEVAGFYRTLVAENHADGVYLEGWLKRAYEEPL